MYTLLTMPQWILAAAGIALIAPPVLECVKPPRWRRLLAGLYLLAIFYITVGIRLGPLLAGQGADGQPQLELAPFWSYGEFDRADIRWQVYLNVLLFVPLGFMLPWCAEGLRRLWRVLLIAAAFSVLTEAAQYFFRIGLCETDDVIHNTLGAALGYGYWRLLTWLRGRVGPLLKRKQDGK